MRIDDLPALPKMYRVIGVDQDALRSGIGGGGGVVFGMDAVDKARFAALSM